VVSVDGGIPLVSHAYPGNRPDVTQFPVMVKELSERFATLLPENNDGTDRLTLVFDAGQNSQANYELVEGSPFHFVGSLPPSDHPDLLAIGKDRYRALDKARFPGLTGFETTKVVFGAERRIVVTHSENLHQKQTRGFEQTLAKARRQLALVAERLEGGKTRKEKDAIEAEIAAILRPRWVARVLSTSLVGDSPAGMRLSFSVRPKARAALEEEIFGKRILFTDKARKTAATAQIVADYRSQETAEGDFRQMKDRSVVSFSPMFHFTEQKIRVHVFYCVLALGVARLMTREADHAGMHQSVRELLDTLAAIGETVFLYQGDRGRPRARRMLTEMNDAQRRLFDLFGLDAYAPAQ
jgi:transposase